MTSLVAMPRGDGRLDSAPPQPPPDQSQLMAMGAPDEEGAGFNNPVVRAISVTGDVKKSLQELAILLPGLAGGVQQMIAALEATVPEAISAMMDGNPLGGVPQGGGGGY